MMSIKIVLSLKQQFSPSFKHIYLENPPVYNRGKRECCEQNAATNHKTNQSLQ